MTSFASRAVLLACITSGVAVASATPAQPPAAGGKVPITTASEDARPLYLQGRDLVEKLRATDAHRLYEAAVAKDPGFALGDLGLATTAATNQDFFVALDHAVALADHASAPAFEFNGLALNYGYVRAKAKRLLQS